MIFAATSTQAFDETKYPDWSGQWRRPAGVGNQWDTSKSPRQGRPPLTPEYQAIYEANLKDQAAGGQGTRSDLYLHSRRHAAGDERDFPDGNRDSAQDHIHHDRISEH